MLYIPSMYIHTQFLTLARVLEAYHRWMYGGRYMSPEEYKPIRDRLKKAIPADITDEHRKSLEDRISFGYEYTLRERLNHLLSEVLVRYSKTLDLLIPDREDFVKRVKNTRNDLTHIIEGSEKKPTTDTNEQYVLIQKMKWVMFLCFFVELGLPSETVHELLTNHHNFQRWATRKK